MQKHPAAEQTAGEHAEQSSVDEETNDKDHDYATYPPDAELRERGVPADEIIAAFRVHPDMAKNTKWWTERMRNTLRYKSLASALVQKGLANKGSKRYPSWWRPDIIASWLIEEKHLAGYRVLPQLKREFPHWAELSEYL